MILDQADIYTNIISPLLELATQDQTISIKRVIAIVIGKEYALKKYAEFMLNTGCFGRKNGSKMTQSSWTYKHNIPNFDISLQNISGA